MNVRLKAETATTVTIEWDAVAGQQGFIPTIDGSDILTDGKRHPNTSKTQTTVKIGKVLDGKGHDYGVHVLVAGQSGSVRVGDPDPGPDPEPTPGQDGAKLAAMFPPLTGPVTKTGALAQRWTPGDGQKLKDWTATGWLSPDAHAIYVNGSDNVAIEDGWCHDMTAGPNRPQVAQIAGGSRNVQIRRVDAHNIGYSKLDHAWYLADCDTVLIASCVMSLIQDYSVHLYGGAATRVVIANCTLYDLSRTGGGEALAICDDAGISGVLFVNCVFHGNGHAKLAIRTRNGAKNVRAENCVWFGCDAFTRDSENPGNPVVQTNVVKADPLFVNAAGRNFKPRPGSPLVGKGNPAWLPALDVHGHPFKTADIGAVAA